MQATRRFTLPAHGAVEFLAGMAMMLAPAVLAFGAAGLVLSASLGAILAGVGLSLSTDDRGQALYWHRQFDQCFLLLTAASALLLAVAGQATAAVFLAAMVGFQVILGLATHYRPGD